MSLRGHKLTKLPQKLSGMRAQGAGECCAGCCARTRRDSCDCGQHVRLASDGPIRKIILYK